MAGASFILDGKKYPVMYTSPLVEKFERYRLSQIGQAPLFLTAEAAWEFLQFSKIEFVKRYCQMGINRRWHDFFGEVKKNYRLDKEGRYDEMTMPEMIEDPANWSEEDIAVFKAMKTAKIEARRFDEN